MRRTTALTVAVLLVIILVAGGLAGCKKKNEQVPAGDAVSKVATSTSSLPATSTSETTTSASQTATGSSGKATAPVKTPPAKMTVRLFFGYEDRAMSIEREVPYSQSVAKIAMTELLKGPSSAELKGLALHSEIPKGTTLRSIRISKGIAKVDLTSSFDDGGGTLSMTMRLAQVVYTLTQYSSIESVEFYMNGKRVETFGGEGLILDRPQRPTDYYDLIPIDA